jgi:hypothetical protein
MSNNAIRPALLLIVAVALIVTTPACKNSDTITGLRQQVTPTPVNIAGAWTGTFNSFDFVDCDSNVPAHATFTQVGTTLDGTLDAASNGCGTSNVVIHATLTGASVDGTIVSSASRYHFSAGSTVHGTLSGSTLTVSLRDPHNQYIPGGTMKLHR